MVGGEDRVSGEYLASTEILVTGTSAWTSVSPLPQKYWNLRVVSLDNTPYMFGQL